MITLQITDDGLGFDSSANGAGKSLPGWGLIGIRERAKMAGGEAIIQSEPGKGTSLLIEVPLGANGAA